MNEKVIIDDEKLLNIYKKRGIPILFFTIKESDIEKYNKQYKSL